MADARLIEEHPYNKLKIPDGTRILIVGTAPPPRFQKYTEIATSKDFDFFYGSQNSRMWQILCSVLGDSKPLHEAESPDQRKELAKQLLKANHLWMRDILQVYSRASAKSAADSAIAPLTFKNLRSTLGEGPTISMLAFTSQQTATWSLQAIKIQKIASNIVECNDRLQNWQSSRKHDHESFIDHYMRKYTQPFANCLIENRSISLAILPTPTRRGPKDMTIEVKKAIYKNLLAYRTMQ